MPQKPWYYKIYKGGQMQRKKTPSLTGSLPRNRVEWLELCIKLSERAISGPESGKDMIEQVKRLENQLVDLLTK